MKNGLQVVTLARILAIKQLNELKAETLINVLLRSLSIDLGTNNEAQKELVHNLEVRPGRFENGLVLFGIKIVRRRRESTANIGGHHGHEIAHDALGKDLLSSWGIDVVDELQESLPLHILASLVGGRIVEGENDTAKLKLLDEQLLALCGWLITEGRELLECRRWRSHQRQRRRATLKGCIQCLMLFMIHIPMMSGRSGDNTCLSRRNRQGLPPCALHRLPHGLI
mmetsp:Transcript_10663/g.22573  ORF Transcript_10663/g.22573 Transcript_10663/m.22573 type:complete len:226 (-) Transcript_10663:199-876(-)